MTNRNALIERIKKWQADWDQLKALAKGDGDRDACQKMKSWEPNFFSLLQALDRSAQNEQGRLWEDEAACSGFGGTSERQIVEKLKEKISKLKLPK